MIGAMMKPQLFTKSLTTERRGSARDSGEDAAAPCALLPRFLTAAVPILLVAALIVLTPSAAQTVSPTELLYQEAQHKQNVERDLPGAIKLYKQIASTKNGDRPVIAKALLGLASCYEKQGQQSEAVYQQIVKDYGDQPAAAAQAQTKLAALQKDRAAQTATMKQTKIEIP